MQAKKDSLGRWIVTEGADRYNETRSAEASSRVLDGSSDHGYWMEYVGHGEVDGVPVEAIYLLDDDQSEIEDEGDFDWDTALANGRIVVDVDRLSDDQWATLQATCKL